MRVYKYYIDNQSNGIFRESTEEEFKTYWDCFGYDIRKEYEGNKLLLKQRKGNLLFAYRETLQV